jgi:hypothetical protein
MVASLQSAVIYAPGYVQVILKWYRQTPERAIRFYIRLKHEGN